MTPRHKKFIMSRTVVTYSTTPHVRKVLPLTDRLKAIWPTESHR